MRCWWKVTPRPRGRAGCWVASGRQQALRCATARHRAGRTWAQSGLRVAGGAVESRLAHPGPPGEYTCAGGSGPEGAGLKGRGSRGGAQVRPTRAGGRGGCGMLSLYAEQNRSHTDRAHASPGLFGTERGEPRARSGRASLGLPGTGAAAGPGGFSDTVRAVGGGAGISPELPPRWLGCWDTFPGQSGSSQLSGVPHAVARDTELGR